MDQQITLFQLRVRAAAEVVSAILMILNRTATATAATQTHHFWGKVGQGNVFLSVVDLIIVSLFNASTVDALSFFKSFVNFFGLESKCHSWGKHQQSSYKQELDANNATRCLHDACTSSDQSINEAETHVARLWEQTAESKPKIASCFWRMRINPTSREKSRISLRLAGKMTFAV